LSSTGFPQARKDGVVVRELPDELLVYDLERHKAHCLNQTAAAVWRHCDGETSASEIGFRLAREFSTPVDEDLVWLALDELSKLDLLESPVLRPGPGMSRAKLVRRVGVVTAALALPAAMTLKVPTASAANCNNQACPPACPSSCTCSGGFCV
jgi:hypothetical protein